MAEVLTAPARLAPPVVEPMVDAGGLVTPIWAAWLMSIAGRVEVGNTGVTRAGPITSDATGVVTVVFDPPFLTTVVYVAVHDYLGVVDSIAGITVDARGFTGTLVNAGGFALPDQTTNFWAVGY